MGKIKRRFMTAAVALTASLALAAPTFAFSPGPNPNPAAVDTCLATIDMQGGLTAGGGPKAGHGGPTNCDHYWQYTGTIGSGS